MKAKTLIVLTGPTAVGKTDLAIRWAQMLDTEILSADSRQFYREMNIGVATPSPDELHAAKHHFIGNLSIHDSYNVSQYETEALDMLQTLFADHDYVVLTGGSGMYIDVVCHGIAELPNPDPQLRQVLTQTLQTEGIAALREQLRLLDPTYLRQVDAANPVRLMRAIEVCLQTGKPFSSFRNQKPKERPFRILKVALSRPREELYARINLRVDMMMEAGLEQEARTLYAFRHLNALKTVGYRELFDHFDGNISLEQAVTQIKTNSRRYAKRQETWLRRDAAFSWFDANNTPEISCLL